VAFPLRTKKLNEDNMKILVTGSSGLVGTALVKALGGTVTWCAG